MLLSFFFQSARAPIPHPPPHLDILLCAFSACCLLLIFSLELPCFSPFISACGVSAFHVFQPQSCLHTQWLGHQRMCVPGINCCLGVFSQISASERWICFSFNKGRGLLRHTDECGKAGCSAVIPSINYSNSSHFSKNILRNEIRPWC